MDTIKSKPKQEHVELDRLSAEYLTNMQVYDLVAITESAQPSVLIYRMNGCWIMEREEERIDHRKVEFVLMQLGLWMWS